MSSYDPHNEIQSRFLKECNFPEDEKIIEPFTFIIFGGSGDLARRKLIPSLFSLFQSGSLPETFAVIGSGTKDFNDESYRNSLFESLTEFTDGPIDNSSWNRFVSAIYYHRGDVNSEESYAELFKKLNTVSADKECGNNVIYYLSVPPTLYELIVEGLGKQQKKVCKYNNRIVVEKPFGRDSKSAGHLNHLLHEYFEEQTIYRIDHYLGKETVQNIIFFRFANSILEPLWNSKYIDNIQITAAESIGIGHRGRYYDKAGVVRDMIQNHLLQLVTIMGMEVPVGFEADLVRNEKLKVLHSIRPFSNKENPGVVFGQYDGGIQNGEKVIPYTQEMHITDDSRTPTYVAMQFNIDNWRWAGVPIYVRSGKRLNRRVTDIVIEFRQPPLRLFGRTCDQQEPNLLRFSIQPDEAITLNMAMKYPKSTATIHPAEFTFNYKETFNFQPHSTYERQLLDTMKGDLTLFAREDEIEMMWNIVDPVIHSHSNSDKVKLHKYEPGSWGPEAADSLLKKNDNFWHTI
jgi:glucose-6-phosphate 1-dehydrogenase